MPKKNNVRDGVYDVLQKILKYALDRKPETIKPSMPINRRGLNLPVGILPYFWRAFSKVSTSEGGADVRRKDLLSLSGSAKVKDLVEVVQKRAAMNGEDES